MTITQSERLDMISRIEGLPGEVEQAISGLSDAQLDTAYRENGWTLRQVVHHLADSHLNAFTRMKLILTEDRPALKTYNQDKWASLADSREPVQTSLALLSALHSRWAALMRAVAESDWQRTGQHPEAGEVSLERLLTIYSGHGTKHIGHIRGLREQKGW